MTLAYDPERRDLLYMTPTDIQIEFYTSKKLMKEHPFIYENVVFYTDRRKAEGEGAKDSLYYLNGKPFKP